MTKTMLYKHPGPHKIHCNKFDYIVTEDIEEALKDGWFLTTPEALEAAQPKAKPEPEATSETEPKVEADSGEEAKEPNAGPTRDEIKKKAKELGIKYPKNIKTPRLQKLVEDKLDELG